MKLPPGSGASAPHRSAEAPGTAAVKVEEESFLQVYQCHSAKPESLKVSPDRHQGSGGGGELPGLWAAR